MVYVKKVNFGGTFQYFFENLMKKLKKYTSKNIIHNLKSKYIEISKVNLY